MRASIMPAPPPAVDHGKVSLHWPRYNSCTFNKRTNKIRSCRGSLRGDDLAIAGLWHHFAFLMVVARVSDFLNSSMFTKDVPGLFLKRYMKMCFPSPYSLPKWRCPRSIT